MATSDGEAAIDESRTEAPLSGEERRQRGHGLSKCGLKVVFLLDGWRRTSGDLEKHKGQGGPEPTALHKVYIEYVPFSSEVIRMCYCWSVEFGSNSWSQWRDWWWDGDRRED